MRSARRTVLSRCAMTIRVTLRLPSEALTIACDWLSSELVASSNSRMRAGADGAGDHDSLSLAAGERVHAFRDHRMHAHRHSLDVGIKTCKPRRLPRLLQRQLDAATNILVEAASRQFPVL